MAGGSLGPQFQTLIYSYPYPSTVTFLPSLIKNISNLNNMLFITEYEPHLVAQACKLMASMRYRQSNKPGEFSKTLPQKAIKRARPIAQWRMLAETTEQLNMAFS